MEKIHYLNGQEIKEKLFEILNVYACFCDEHHLKYYLCGGTLLGAIRHKDFIPWDDDIDVMMPRPDYNKLLDLLKTESIGGKFFLKCFEHNDSIFPFAKIVSKEFKVRCHCNDYDNFLWIDIFPIDGVPNHSVQRSILLKKAKIYRSMFSSSITKYFTGTSRYKAIIKTPKLFIAHVMGHEHWIRKINELIQGQDFENASYVCSIAWSSGEIEKMKKCDFLNSIEVEFHGAFFHAPSCWHEYLSGLYGDYMILPAPNKRYGHMMKVHHV